MGNACLKYNQKSKWSTKCYEVEKKIFHKPRIAGIGNIKLLFNSKFTILRFGTYPPWNPYYINSCCLPLQEHWKCVCLIRILWYRFEDYMKLTKEDYQNNLCLINIHCYCTNYIIKKSQKLNGWGYTTSISLATDKINSLYQKLKILK